MSWYVTTDKLAPLAEHSSLKEAEKDLRTRTPGSYLIVRVMRTATIAPVPESTRLTMSATRKRK